VRVKFAVVMAVLLGRGFSLMLVPFFRRCFPFVLVFMFCRFQQVQTFRRIDDHSLVFVEVAYRFIDPQLQAAAVVGKNVCVRQRHHVFCSWLVIVRLHSGRNDVGHFHMVAPDTLGYVFERINSRIYFWLGTRIAAGLRCACCLIGCAASGNADRCNQANDRHQALFHLCAPPTQFKMIPI